MGSSGASEFHPHRPVLLKEVLRLLDPKPGQVVVDATVGSGGHAREILKRIVPTGRLIAIDQDPAALERARQNLKEFSQADYIHGNFAELEAILRSLNRSMVDAVILDVGLSSEQLEEAGRGFSFLKEGPLDMRMDPGGLSLKARDLVNDLSQGELENLFRTYGEERWSRRIAGTICQERVKKPIETTADLVRIIQKAVPASSHSGIRCQARRPRHALGRARHPATRIFQALRIRVNQELEALERVLPQAFAVLRPEGGRLAVITFHSLEDRIVKHWFRKWAFEGRARLLIKKPVRPEAEEIRANPRSRSAKLRVLMKEGGR